MNRLPILLLLYLLSIGSAKTAMVEPSDVSFGPSGVSNFVHDISDDENNLTTLSKFQQTPQFTSQTDAAPPTLWIVGLGLCLVYLGYKMKNKAE
jgi:hypothetical protein